MTELSHHNKNGVLYTIYALQLERWAELYIHVRGRISQGTRTRRNNEDKIRLNRKSATIATTSIGFKKIIWILRTQQQYDLNAAVEPLRNHKSIIANQSIVE